jgi:hypothetical protein
MQLKRENSEESKSVSYAEGMQILREWRVFQPAIVRVHGLYHVCSRTAVEGSGPKVEDALKAAGYLPRRGPSNQLPFVAVEFNVVQGNDAVCVARTKTVAQRIANALNEYIPGDRGF